MMIWQRILAPCVLAGLLTSGNALAQAGSPDARFVNAPEIGDQFPDVTIVDDQGTPVNIRELASQSPYTVITLGCLT